MAKVASSSSQEYWRSPNPEVMRLVTSNPEATPCWRCGADYAPAARFCHVCGSQRDSAIAASAGEPQPSFHVPHLLDTRNRLALSLASWVFFVFGVACMIAATLTSVIYKTDTLVDWQAVQLWRIEWLLAASAALLAGVFLKRRI